IFLLFMLFFISEKLKVIVAKRNAKRQSEKKYLSDSLYMKRPVKVQMKGSVNSHCVTDFVVIFC
ncbi:hypothetical protein EGH82_19780, partial [Vibrio ponticus]